MPLKSIYIKPDASMNLTGIKYGDKIVALSLIAHPTLSDANALIKYDLVIKDSANNTLSPSFSTTATDAQIFSNAFLDFLKDFDGTPVAHNSNSGSGGSGNNAEWLITFWQDYSG